MDPGPWFVGESETDHGERGFDGTVWEAPTQEEQERQVDEGGEYVAGPWLVAEGITHRPYADLIAAAPVLKATLDEVDSGLQWYMANYGDNGGRLASLRGLIVDALTRVDS